MGRQGGGAALARPRRLRPRNGGRGRRRPGRRELGPGDDQRDGGARRQRRPGRAGARARVALRRVHGAALRAPRRDRRPRAGALRLRARTLERSEEHTSELQSRQYLVCRLLLEKKKKTNYDIFIYKKKTKKHQ